MEQPATCTFANIPAAGTIVVTYSPGREVKVGQRWLPVNNNSSVEMMGVYVSLPFLIGCGCEVRDVA